MIKPFQKFYVRLLHLQVLGHLGRMHIELDYLEELYPKQVRKIRDSIQTMKRFEDDKFFDRMKSLDEN